MGGGGAMRAAAKVAGINVFNTGLRAEHPVTAAARKAARPVSGGLSSSEEVKLVANTNNNGGKIDSPVVQRPYWDIEDWEFAGAEDELVMESGEPTPRVVFGGPPTIQEAKEATDELKDVLEKVYLSTETTPRPVGRVGSGQDSGLLLLSDSEFVETKPCLTSEAAVTPSAPKNAMQAFRFLHESPGAQTVVASIARDPNVWNAVMQNEALVEFLQSQKADVVFPETNPSVNESVAGDDCQGEQPKKSFDESSDYEEPMFGKSFMDTLENIKQNIRVKVVEMMTILSDTFQNLFGSPLIGESSDSARSTLLDKTIGASFMGLAIMVIMVVVLKRS